MQNPTLLSEFTLQSHRVCEEQEIRDMGTNQLRFSTTPLVNHWQNHVSCAPISQQTCQLNLHPSLYLHFPHSLTSSPNSTTTSKRRNRFLLRIDSAAQPSLSIPLQIQPEQNSDDTLLIDRTRLVALNIPWTCTSADIHSLFGQFGTVTDVQLSMHNSTRNRGLAFITMGSKEEALAALNKLDSYELEGRAIRVQLAKKLKKSVSATTTENLTKKYSVFVGNLAWRIRSSHLRELFAANGNVLSTEVVFQSKPRKSAGYGFVSFSSREYAEAAITAFDGKKLMGRPIRLALSKVRTNPSGEESKEGNISEVRPDQANGDKGQSVEHGGFEES